MNSKYYLECQKQNIWVSLYNISISFNLRGDGCQNQRKEGSGDNFKENFGECMYLPTNDAVSSGSLWLEY